jgi:hypothetical protein
VRRGSCSSKWGLHFQCTCCPIGKSCMCAKGPGVVVENRLMWTVSRAVFTHLHCCTSFACLFHAHQWVLWCAQQLSLYLLNSPAFCAVCFVFLAAVQAAAGRSGAHAGRPGAVQQQLQPAPA